MFVGNLPFTTTSENLADWFGAYGEVIGVNIRKDRQTGKSKGFAFVSFAAPEGDTSCAAAHDAIRAMHGKEVGGRKLTVSGADKRGSKDSKDEKKRKKSI